jgi:hypothetical protein
MLSNKYIKNKTIKIWGATDELREELDTLETRVELSFYRGMVTPIRSIEEILGITEDPVTYGRTIN